MTKIAGSVALVTGGAGGIGRAIADQLRAGGATVVTTDLPGTAVDVTADVTDAGAVHDVVEGVVAQHGRIDVAVANAGIAIAGVIEALDDDAWRRTLDVNLWGTINLLRAVYPHFVDRRAGHFVAVASLAGVVPTPLLVPYSASKHAVVGLVTSMRPEAARHGIGMSVVCPGPVETPLLHTGGAGGAVHGVDTRRYLTDAAGPAISSDIVAVAALRAIERNRRLVAPKRAGILWRATRLAPGGAERMIGSNMRRELRRAGQTS